MDDFNEVIDPKVLGQLVIKDLDSGQVLFNKLYKNQSVVRRNENVGTDDEQS